MPKSIPSVRRPRSWWLVLGLLILSPICAEYLSAYDDSTGHPAALLGNLVIFIPLYGCAALLIREVARRARLGWTGILLLAAAFGLIEAGLVDQSLFSPDYRGLEGWDAMFSTTLIGPLGLSAVNVLSFIGGHVMLSICGPIALVEAWRPQRAAAPWLRLPGLVITALAYGTASVFVLLLHLQTESWHAAAGQLIGSGVVVVALIVAAVGLGRRTRSRRDASGPGLGRTAVVALVLATVYNVMPPTWLGAAGSTAVLVISGWLLVRASRTRRWSPTHAAVVGSAPLVLTALLAFTYDPMIGEVTAAAKYAHNAVMVAIVLAALSIALLRRPRPCAGRGFLDLASAPVDELTGSVDSRDR
ncbi:MAG TPA: hypothetical protein VFU98_12680 [Microlunatus sp.]|nr:hypothetical protein [Microlunatus sp.]